MNAELFLDDETLSTTRNIERRVETPAKHPRNPLVVSDYPWVSTWITLCGSVLRDESDAGFRMWYMALANGGRA